VNKKIIIPNAITGLSLISGLTALHFTFENSFILAAWLIAFSMLCDGLDGKIARLLNAQSRFGAQFDTLSDFVTFGVIPGFMVYRYKLSELSTIGIIIAVFYVFAGSYRLVRFTLKNHQDNHKKQPFIGLPIPAGAGIIASFIIFDNYQSLSAHFFLITTFFAGLLMISQIEYLPLEKGKKLTNESKFFIAAAIISLLFVVKFSYFVFGLWISLYILYGIVRQIILFVNKMRN